MLVVSGRYRPAIAGLELFDMHAARGGRSCFLGVYQ
jgi:hypothetical protein